MKNKRVKSEISCYNFFPKNRRGLSGIITALILIVLVLVASGIVWLVYNNLIKGSSEDITYADKCLGILIDAAVTGCANVTDTTYNCTFTLTRVGGSTGESVDGVGITFADATQSSDEFDIPGNVGSKVTKTKGPVDFNATEANIRIYLLKTGTDEKYFCSAA